MKITSIAPKKTPLGPCSQRVAASCVAREPQHHQQNINKYHHHHLLWHLGFPCWECDEELASQKPKSYHSWSREQFSCHKVEMSKKCQANLRSRGGGGNLSKETAEELHLIHLKQSWCHQNPNSKISSFQFFIPNRKKDSLPVSAAPTTSFRWRSAGNRHRAWPWSKLRSGEPLPKWTQHRWFLAHPADHFFL